MSNMNDESRGALALANAEPRALGRVGIIGAGAAGSGIAIKLLDADVPVTLVDASRESVAQAIGQIRAGYQAGLDQGALAAEKIERRMALLTGTDYFHHLKDCDLIIEAGDADLDASEDLFRRLDQVAKPGAILMTNAAPGGVDRVARGTRRGGEVLGWRVPDPVGASGMGELVCGKQTSADTLASVMALAALFHEAPPGN